MENNIKDYWQDYKDKVSKAEDIFKSIYNDLNTNPKYQDYFNQFHPDSIISFKERFARYKTNCIVHEQFYRDKEEELIHQHLDTASKCLWEIQHFKLLQLEGLWRSNQITLSEIKYTHQFTYWHSHIEECRFIDPITEDEVDTYINYLKQEESEDIFWAEYMHGLKPFEDLKESIEADEELPPYVAYMTNLFGKKIFLINDIKGANEERYSDANAEEAKKNEANKVDDTVVDTRPYMSLHKQENFEDIVSKFGEPRMVEYRKINEELMHFYSGWHYFEDSCALLEEAGDDYPVEGYADWHYALIAAANNYKKDNVIKALKAAYKEYLFRLNNGIAFSKYDGYRFSSNTYDWFSREMEEKINNGMRLLGEDDAVDND